MTLKVIKISDITEELPAFSFYSYSETSVTLIFRQGAITPKLYSNYE